MHGDRHGVVAAETGAVSLRAAAPWRACGDISLDLCGELFRRISGFLTSHGLALVLLDRLSKPRR